MENNILEKNYSQKNLDRLHETLLEIFLYVKGVCEENGLEYAIIAGTALGAVRHKGFIPWDDDLDIALRREDYEKLCKILKESGDDRYILQDITNEEGYFLPFVKVRKKGTLFVEKMYADVYREKGAFIDIFSLDEVREPGSLAFKLRLIRIKFYLHALMFRAARTYYKEHRSRARYLLDLLAYIPFAGASNKTLLDRAEKLIKKDNGKGGRYLLNFASTYKLSKEIFLKESLFPCRLYAFEGHKVSSYRDMEAYLRSLYGDYMELPPEDKRHSHEPLELKL